MLSSISGVDRLVFHCPRKSCHKTLSYLLNNWGWSKAKAVIRAEMQTSLVVCVKRQVYILANIQFSMNMVGAKIVDYNCPSQNLSITYLNTPWAF